MNEVMKLLISTSLLGVDGDNGITRALRENPEYVPLHPPYPPQEESLGDID